MTPTRPDTMKHLARIVKNALDNQDVVAIGDTSFVFKEKGAVWTSGDSDYEALATGIYIQARVFRGGVEQDPTYLFQNHLDELPQLLNMLCSEMTLDQVEELRFDLGARNVLKSMNPKRNRELESPSP